MTNTPFSERQAKYAAWREQMRDTARTNRIDLAALDAKPDDAGYSVWSTEALFAVSRAAAVTDADD